MGLASTQPRQPNTTPENRALNRRVEIVVDLSNAPRETPTTLDDLPPDTLVEPQRPANNSGSLSW